MASFLSIIGGMETIFDHNPTPEELEEFFFIIPERASYVPIIQDTEYAHIYRLYKMRGNDEMAAEYLSKITSRDIRFTASTRDYI